jgi:hypothetical protein
MAEAPRDAWIRIKIVTECSGESLPTCLQKMMAVKVSSYKLRYLKPGHELTAFDFIQASMTWGSFKVAAASKLGYSESTHFEFFWEGCTIEEADETCIDTFFKDGDSILIKEGATADDSHNYVGDRANVGPAVGPSSRPASASQGRSMGRTSSQETHLRDSQKLQIDSKMHQGLLQKLSSSYGGAVLQGDILSKQTSLLDTG